MSASVGALEGLLRRRSLRGSFSLDDARHLLLDERTLVVSLVLRLREGSDDGASGLGVIADGHELLRRHLRRGLGVGRASDGHDAVVGDGSEEGQEREAHERRERVLPHYELGQGLFHPEHEVDLSRVGVDHEGSVTLGARADDVEEAMDPVLAPAAAVAAPDVGAAGGLRKAVGYAMLGGGVGQEPQDGVEDAVAERRERPVAVGLRGEHQPQAHLLPAQLQRLLRRHREGDVVRRHALEVQERRKLVAKQRREPAGAVVHRAPLADVPGAEGDDGRRSAPKHLHLEAPVLGAPQDFAKLAVELLQPGQAVELHDVPFARLRRVPPGQEVPEIGIRDGHDLRARRRRSVPAPRPPGAERVDDGEHNRREHSGRQGPGKVRQRGHHGSSLAGPRTPALSASYGGPEGARRYPNANGCGGALRAPSPSVLRQH
mmetsp:Transcript_6189/g.17270  ORF Transcript_6189/g.17270 Transcript_6189/m.17270 type:complete len:432 (-) Transcript_6189:47-1342(-)